MKHMLWLVLALICLDVSTLSAAPQTAELPPLPMELRDPAFLRQLTWQADKRLENLVAGWFEREPSRGNRGHGDSTIIQRFTLIQIIESEFLATYEIYNTKGDANIVFDMDLSDKKRWPVAMICTRGPRGRLASRKR